MLELLFLAVVAQAPHVPAPLVLEAPVSRWDDGLPLGNGAQGVLVWGEGNVVRLSLDRGDLWDERTPDMLQREDWTYATMKELVANGPQQKLHELFDVPYDTVPYPTKLPGGRIELVFPEGTNVQRFSLDLASAQARVELGATTVRLHVSATLPYTVVRVDGAKPQVRLVPPQAVKRLDYAPASVVSDGERQWYVQEAAQGGAYGVACVRHDDEQGSTLLIHVGKRDHAPREGESLDSWLGVGAQLQVAMPYEWLLQQWHESWWKEHWGASSVRVPDERIQAQYDLVRYLYGAGSRVDQLGRGGAPIALQGLWTADEGGLPPWKGDYHNDLNTQTTYIAQLPMGHAEAGLCFLQHLANLQPTFERFARSFYAVDGLVVPGVMTLEGRAMGGWGQYSLSPTNTAWLALLFDEHWRYTRDRKFLESVVHPWCAQAGRALAALLAPDSAGHLRLPLSSSPEIFDNSPRSWLAPNSNYDQALLRWLFGALARQANELGRAEEAAKWSDVLARLEPLDVDAESGALTFARGLPYDSSHRHFSHAMAIHPLGTITIEGSESERHTIDATLEQLERHGGDWWTGYSFSWFSCMLARTGRPEKALAQLENYLAFTGRNGFHLNGDQSGKGLSKFTYRPFTLEGNMLAAQAVHEMLLQSWGGVVRVFPATSERWTDVEFDNLRAEGAFRVSAKRIAGRTRSVTVVSELGGELRLRDPFGGAPFKADGAVLERKGTDLVGTLKAGERVVLSLAD
ncbi:MAG: glycoside hydrolase N-terminal domain-containing protein [Planctomycetota bacterium]|nr:glycoside hydrolase N-terminal domain-containing protein [Planctomycetota bacterium]